MRVQQRKIARREFIASAEPHHHDPAGRRHKRNRMCLHTVSRPQSDEDCSEQQQQRSPLPLGRRAPSANVSSWSITRGRQSHLLGRLGCGRPTEPVRPIHQGECYGHRLPSRCSKTPTTQPREVAVRPLCDHLPAPGPSSDCPLRSSPPTVASMIKGFRRSGNTLGYALLRLRIRSNMRECSGHRLLSRRL